MRQERNSKHWFVGVAGVALAFAGGAAFAQESDEPIATREAPASSEEIVVQGQIAYRNRSEGVTPVLQYGLDYFQRFEPLTVGDALKRVPSVAFLSDVLESDGVRLRGLDPAYTQILINGEQVPGSGDSSGAFGNGADSAFFVDRIPAELIERVEIVRSQSANRSGDAVAGAINIVLRDSYSLEGGYVRAGALYWENDQTWGGTLGGVWGGEVGGGRLLIGANVQDRHNPKDKLSTRFEPDDGEFELVNTEVQTDVRDGTDYSGNFSYEIDALGGALGFDGFYVHTDRVQDEDSIEYTEGVETDENIETVNDNNVDIEQDSYSLNGRYTLEALGGETRIKLGYARFENSAFEFEDEAGYAEDEEDDSVIPFPDIDVFESEIAQSDLTDEEIKAKFEHSRDVGALQLEFGVQYEHKERDNLIRSADDDFESDDPADFADIPLGGAFVDRSDLEPVAGGDNSIERTRIDPYVMISGDTGAFGWEAGLRYETTEISIEDRLTDDDVVTTTASDGDYAILLPSASLKWELTEVDRILVSVARTARNPSFGFLSPAVLEEELGDNDFRGNPALEPETAWGGDLGYERRLGRTGVFGVNFFYRDITDLIEVYNTLEPSVAALEELEEDPDFEVDTFTYSARNTGDGQVWGVEFDFSAPLTIIGLENTGVFVNYSWLDSKVEDEFGERTFNSQAESVFNAGFIQDLPALAASFGLTYRDQGDAYSRVVGEEVTTTYSADLELFIEKRIGERFTIRFTGSNLLDASKDESFNKFKTLNEQLSHGTDDFDEYELETESAGPVFQLVGRLAF